MSDIQQQKIVFNATMVIIVLGMLNGLLPFATDIYLPAFSTIGDHFNTSIGQVALTMSSYFAGSCIGHFINGPILDKYGRKKPMMVGLGIFFIASLACPRASVIEGLIVFRFFQAVGISMCSVGGKALVRDLYPPEQTARIFSILGMIMGIAPIIAPSIGSWLLIDYGWESVFYFLALFSIILIVLLWRYIPDSFEPEKAYALSFSNISSKYLLLLKYKKYMGYTILTAFGGTILFVWITSSSFLFIELLGLTETEYGLVFAVTSVSLIISNQLNLLLLKKYNSEQISLVSIVLMVLTCFALFYIIQYHFTATNMVVGICILMSLVLLFRVNVMSLALNCVDEDLGVASALLGGIRMAMSAMAIFALSYFLTSSAVPMLVFILVMGVVSLVIQLRMRSV